MKRSDLKVGGSYYYDRSTNWEDRTYGGGDKAVVVDDKRYTIRKSDWGWRRDEPRHHEDPKGTAVLVDIHRETVRGELRVEREAVPVAHLRGPYEATKAAVDARVAAHRQAERSATQQRETDRESADAASRAAAVLGVDARQDFRYDDRVTVPTAQFAAMVQALAEAGWRYEKSENVR